MATEWVFYVLLCWYIQVRGKNRNMYSMVGPVPLELKTGKTTFSAEHKGQVKYLKCADMCDFVS